MALWQAQPPPMPEMFALAPPPEGSKTTTTTVAAATEERSPQPEAVEERGPAIDVPAPQASSS